jgi:uncharacterized protein YjbJ (UPF0337 family)
MKSPMPDKDKSKGVALQLKGKVKEAAAEVIGDGELAEEGRDDEARAKAMKKRAVQGSIRGH